MDTLSETGIHEISSARVYTNSWWKLKAQDLLPLKLKLNYA